MSFPNIPHITPLISVTVGQTIPLLLSSIALEELALAHIMNAEAEKLQFVLGTLGDTQVAFSPAEVSLEDLLDVNTSVRKTLRDVIKKEMLLEFKFENVLDLLATLEPAPTPRPTQILAPAGGFVGVNLAATDSYTCALNTWVSRAPMPEVREGHAGGLLPDGRVIVSHGFSGGDTADVRFYNPVTNTWSIGPSAAVARAELMGAVLGGKFYAVGGRTALNTVEIFDPISNTWSPGPSMATGRGGLGVVALNGLLHAIGGRDGSAPLTGTAFTVHEVFDPTTNTWSTRASLPAPRMDIYSTEVFDGKIYVFGGFDGTNTVNTVFIYDPISDSWSTGSPMPTTRSNASACVCGNEIFVLGGVDASAVVLATVEAYNPVTDTWRTDPAAMPNARAEFPCISLP